MHRNHLAERRFVFPVYLPVSGQARQTVHALPLPRFIVVKFIWGARPRTHQTHLTVEYVEKLRQLIQTARTQNSTERGQAMVAISVQLRHRTIDSHQIFEIAFVNLCLSAQPHGAELPDEKMSAAQANAFLPVENRTRRGESRNQPHKNHWRELARQ